MLILFLLAVAGGLGILYGGYTLFRQGSLEDEERKRERLAEEAKYAEEVEKKFPKSATKSNADKIKEFLERRK